MSRHHHPTLLLAAVLLSTVCYLANAEAPPDKPVPPYVAAVPDYFQWTITVNSASAPGSTLRVGKDVSDRDVVKVQSVKTKDIKLERFITAGGAHFDLWRYRDYIVTKSASGEISFISADSLAGSAMLPDLSARGFWGVDWITGDTCMGVKPVAAGKRAFVYSGTATVLQVSFKGDPVKTLVPMQASIDQESMLPITVTKGPELLSYSYGPPPTGMLMLPPDIQARITEMEARDKALNSLRALAHH